MTVPTFRIAAACLAFVAVLGATACAPSPEPRTSPSVTAGGGPTPTPTPDALLVGPGERPPQLFDGDCDAMVRAAEVAAAIGTDLTADTPTSYTELENLGGVSCTWSNGSALVSINVVPRHALDGVTFPADEESTFESCDANWVCSWRWESDLLWAAGDVSGVEGMSRANVDAWAAELAALFDGRSAPVTWSRDRAGWWQATDCVALGQRVGEELGIPVVGADNYYLESATPVQIMIDAATDPGFCTLAADEAATYVEVRTVPGGAWSNVGVDADPFDSGVPGLTAHRDRRHWSADGTSYTISDGISSAKIAVTRIGGGDADEVARAVARAMP